ELARGPKKVTDVGEVAHKAHVDPIALEQARADLGVVTSRPIPAAPTPCSGACRAERPRSARRQARRACVARVFFKPSALSTRSRASDSLHGVEFIFQTHGWFSIRVG